MTDKELFDIYMKLKKEELVKLLIDSQKRNTIVPNQIVYPYICPPFEVGDAPPLQRIWYATSTDTKIVEQKTNFN